MAKFVSYSYIEKHTNRWLRSCINFLLNITFTLPQWRYIQFEIKEKWLLNVTFFALVRDDLSTYIKGIHAYQLSRETQIFKQAIKNGGNRIQLYPGPYEQSSVVAKIGPANKDATLIYWAENILGLKSMEKLDTIWRYKYQILSNFSNNEKDKSSYGKSRMNREITLLT